MLLVRFFVLAIICCPIFSHAQVGIGTTNPDPSAKLDISASDKGILIPRVSLTASNAEGPITTPLTGLLVYNAATVTGTTGVTPGFYFWDGSGWVKLITPSDNALNVTATVAVANGGTGSTTAAGAISSLGVIASSEKGANNGVATLGSDGKVPSNQIPAVSFQSATVVANEAAMLGLTNTVVGSIAIRTDINKNFVLSAAPATTLSNWIELATPTAVTSVNGSSGPNVTLTASSLSATTIGNNLFTLVNPNAISFPRLNANNTVSTLSAADFRTAIGAGTSSTNGTVTSIGLTTGTTGNDVSISGSPITSSGTITLNIPDASASARGLVATGAQTFAGVKTFQSAPILLSTTASRALFTDVNKNIVSNAITGSGNVVMSTSPTLTTPSITTPTIESGSGQYPNSILINPSTHATSRRAAIWVDDWAIMQDIQGNGTKNFSISQRVVGTPTTYPSRLFINTDGSIGIGTDAPAAKLHIQSSGIGTGFRLADGSQGSSKILTSDANGNASWQTGSVVLYTEVHTNGGASQAFVNNATYNEFSFTTADNIQTLYANQGYGFIDGTGNQNFEAWEGGNLLFGDQKLGDLMTIGMKSEDAKEWFGISPPDLTLETSLRGPDWVYTYLKSFYLDSSRPLGVNNKVYENVGMPHVLANLQGRQNSVCKLLPIKSSNGGLKQDPLTGDVIYEEICGFLEVESDTGEMGKEEFNQSMRDITNFLAYMADPIKLKREKMGVYVILYLLIFTIFSYLLYREFKKEVH